MIVLVGGLPGSGKTYFASRLATRIHGHHLSSDALRKSLGKTGKYDTRDKLLVYRELARAAENKVSETETPVIIDATFSHHEMRELFQKLASTRSVPIKFIWIYASEQLIKERTSVPRQDSEADYNIYFKIRDEAELWDMPHLRLESTDSNIGTMLEKALEYILSDATK